MKRFILIACALAVPALAFAADSGPFYNSPSYTPQGRSLQNNTLQNYQEMQRRSSEKDQEWRRRDDEDRRRADDAKQRDLWMRENERRRENARRADERTRDWEQRREYEASREERFANELMQRDAQKGKEGKGGSYREPEYKGKALNPKELHRYELLKPGERP